MAIEGKEFGEWNVPWKRHFFIRKRVNLEMASEEVCFSVGE